MVRHAPAALAFGAVLGSLLASPAWANGQTTHIWISLHALEHLEEGELRELLRAEGNRDALVNGTMFPDGGYAINDGYGEIAHWEGFQQHYLDWIRAEQPAPYSDEGEQHVAFLMGMMSHGHADQTFDTMYVPRAQVEDEGLQDGGWNFDMASDVIVASEVGAMEVPGDWVPSSTLVELMAEVGHEVTEETMLDGQDLLDIAVGWVGSAGQNDDIVDDYVAQYPWGAEHMLDADVPGSPPCQGELIAAYWQEAWLRLQGEPWTTPLAGTYPFEDGGFLGERDAEDIASRVFLTLTRGFAAPAPGEGLHVVDSGGTEHPVDAWVGYGDLNHVLVIQPLEDWAEDADYTVTIEAGLESRDGAALASDIVFSFTTDPTIVVERTSGPGAEGCQGCVSAPGPRGPVPTGLLLLSGLMAVSRRRRRAAPWIGEAHAGLPAAS